MDSGKRAFSSIGGLALATVLFASIAVGAETFLDPVKSMPQATGVLLLPALDGTKDAANMLKPRQAVIRHREQAEFIKRQFTVLGETLATQAAEAPPKIDLTQPRDRTAENLAQLAERAKAEWVVSVTVEDVDMITEEAGDLIASTRVHLKIWDARRKDWLADRSYTARATGNGAPPMVFMQSLDQAVRDVLAPQLQTFPSVIRLEKENSLVDYLEGQTEPFVPNPKTAFGGLKASDRPSLR